MPRLNHIGLFQFKPGCTADEIELVRRTLAQLPGEIPGILGFNWSPDISVEDLTDGFTHSFMFIFENITARDDYLPHPAHQSAVRVVMPLLERVIVVDQVVS